MIQKSVLFKWFSARSWINRRLFFSLTFLFSFLPGTAQDLRVGTLSFENYYRRSQLIGGVDSTISFALRPLSLHLLPANDSLFSLVGKSVYRSSGGRSRVQILPILWQQQYESNSTRSWNDGLIIPAKGYQTLVSAGAYAKIGPLRIQLKPEFIFAENRIHGVRKAHYGSADLPLSHGGKSYSQLSWGQSSVHLDFDPVSVGISNQNLWWGPGIQNSLLMSNTAPGFKHLTLNTTRPVRTPVGSFEAQIVAGRLENSEQMTGLPYDWRYLSGLALSYQPRWVPGLFLGLTRSFQIYQADMDNSFGDIFPFFQAFQKVKTNEDAKRRDQLTSLFARWVMPAAKAEVYFEYGLNDHSYNIRDFVMAPEHSRAYMLGMKKLVPYRQRRGEFIEISGEITHMEQSIDRVVRDAGEWYTHWQVLNGYTHRGQILGAGIGPGGNMQSLQVAWVKDLKQLGVQLERYEHNGDLANVYGFSPWIDIGLATVADWSFSKFVLSGKLQGVQSINYQWMDGLDGRSKRNVFYINAKLGMVYSF